MKRVLWRGLILLTRLGDVPQSSHVDGETSSCCGVYGSVDLRSRWRLVSCHDPQHFWEKWKSLWGSASNILFPNLNIFWLMVFFSKNENTYGRGGTSTGCKPKPPGGHQSVKWCGSCRHQEARCLYLRTVQACMTEYFNSLQCYIDTAVAQVNEVT